MSDRADWLAARRSGIGGSDAAAVLGLSPWRTPLAVYLEKRGEGAESAETEPMRWGTRLEPLVRQEYADRAGEVVRVPDGLLRHPAHQWMLATIDGVTDSGRLVEIKTARSAEGWGEPGTDQVPQAYLIQVQHYLAVTALPVADVAVLIGGSDYRQYEVPADRELHEMLIEQEAAFWARVQSGEPPEPVNAADAARLWGRASREQRVVATDAVAEAVARLRALKLRRAEMDAEEESARLAVMQALGEADTLVGVDGSVLCTWRAAKPAQRLDGAALKAARPDIYTQFLRAGEPSRRMLIK